MGVHWALGGGTIASTTLSTLGLGLALRLQHRQQRLDEAQQARLIYGWLEPGYPSADGQTVFVRPIVRNASLTPVTSVTVSLMIVTTEGPLRTETGGGAVTLGLLLPGDQHEFDQVGERPAAETAERFHRLYVAFTDSVGNRWQIRNGRLILVGRFRKRWLERVRPLPAEVDPLSETLRFGSSKRRRRFRNK